MDNWWIIPLLAVSGCVSLLTIGLFRVLLFGMGEPQGLDQPVEMDEINPVDKWED